MTGPPTVPPPSEAGGTRRDLGALIADLGRERLTRRERVGLLGRLAAALAGRARAAGGSAWRGGRWLADAVSDVAPSVVIRERAALERAYHCTGDALAETLIRAASRTTAAIGAAGGALAAAEYAAAPALLGVPVQVAAETLATVAVELRLIGELHEVYGVVVPGGPRERASALVMSWVRRRGVNPFAGGVALGTAARRELQRRIVRRFGRSLTTAAPFLAGAVAGATLNRRETAHLGRAVAKDLRPHSSAAHTWWRHPTPPDAR